ncbi:MAG: hypothetical protein AAF548_17605 [Actinomycetota bacterium]
MHVYGDIGVDGRAYRAVHGHFSPSQFWSAGRNAALIMWLRDPAERIASYYDFWRSSAPHGNPNHDEFLASEMSLVEFAAWEPIRSEFEQKYADGLSPDAFDFLGVTERYDADLPRLADLLGWRTAGAASRVNVTPGERAELDPATRAEIESHHGVELDWYRRVTR